MNFTEYQDAVSYIESYIRAPADFPPTRKEQESLWQSKLPAMEHLLARMGDPQRQFPSVQVGGTSGKGSTSTFIAAILRAAGYRTGLHTSPYLQTAIEKVQVSGQPMPPQDLVALVTWATPIIERAASANPYWPMNYVQIWAALAFAYFARRKVDIAVVEVSLGGRFDYTNVLNPLVAAITTVDFDHTTTLGTTLREIAWHKAGIIKPGATVVTGVQHREALDVIETECQQQAAQLLRLDRDLRYSVKHLDVNGTNFDFQGQDQRYSSLVLAMLGEHQVRNACVALGAVEALRLKGMEITEEAIRTGLRAASVPGRLEIVQQHPTVVLDGAHNPEKARTLLHALERLFPHRPLVFVLGIGAAKEAPEILQVLAPAAQLVVCTAVSVPGKPASLPETLILEARALGVNAVASPDPSHALDEALSAAGPDAVVCVTGSLFLVGLLRERWHPTEDILAAAAQLSAFAR